MRKPSSAAPPLRSWPLAQSAPGPPATGTRALPSTQPSSNNPNRAAFGGTLYSMTDPFFGIMAYGRLGRDYRVWNTVGSIEFLAPGRGTVTATMHLPRQQVDAIRDTTHSGAKSITDHTAEILDETGTLVARATQKLYVRHLRRQAVD
ncbi:DUF4442 domain-containing protein [Nocardia sp. ET3-3]|uniref:DUF4442 domain-containing protein n=1 Tax=Nocardia terrae TaxID=2675851 RepID=A0A7K1V9G2_9NOCA|nr:DUF4442 domain-containing protein [Nocardia terrae]MVU83283.1 DUF4442 domain-containing protein [Nocardia terrae]